MARACVITPSATQRLLISTILKHKGHEVSIPDVFQTSDDLAKVFKDVDFVVADGHLLNPAVRATAVYAIPVIALAATHDDVSGGTAEKRHVYPCWPLTYERFSSTLAKALAKAL